MEMNVCVCMYMSMYVYRPDLCFFCYDGFIQIYILYLYKYFSYNVSESWTEVLQLKKSIKIYSF